MLFLMLILRRKQKQDRRAIPRVVLVNLSIYSEDKKRKRKHKLRKFVFHKSSATCSVTLNLKSRYIAHNMEYIFF